MPRRTAMNRWLVIVLGLAAFLLLANWEPAGALTAASAPQEPKAAAHGEEGKVEIFQPAIELGIWTLAVFLVLMAILWLYAWGPLKEGLHKREQGILSAINEAKKAREEAQSLRAEWQKQLDSANDKVRGILDEARRDAQHATEEMVSKARTEIQSERDRLRREIDTARDQAIQELWKQTANLATMISSKAIRRQLTPDDHRRLVDEALVEIGRTPNGSRQ